MPTMGVATTIIPRRSATIPRLSRARPKRCSRSNKTKPRTVAVPPMNRKSQVGSQPSAMMWSARANGRLIAPCRCGISSRANATATRRSSKTAKIALRDEQARIAALAIVVESSAVTVLANLSAPTGPRAAASADPCINHARSTTTSAISTTAPRRNAELRTRVRAIRAPSKQPAAPPVEAATTDSDGAMVATRIPQASPWIIARPTSANAPANPMACAPGAVLTRLSFRASTSARRRRGSCHSLGRRQQPRTTVGRALFRPARDRREPLPRSPEVSIPSASIPTAASFRAPRRLRSRLERVRIGAS